MGLASRRIPDLFPAALGKYPGDALWTLMVFAFLGGVFTKTSTVRLAMLAFTIAGVVEFSQLYQAPWIRSIRQQPFGHFILGSTFNAPDLIAYLVGVTLGAVLEFSVRVTRKRKSTK